MALTTSTITGRVPLPTDENLQYAELTFALSGLDTEGADVLPGGISTRIVLIDSDIPPGFELWQNMAGLHGTHYRVLARWTVKDRDGVREQYADLGIIQVGSDPSYPLADLLNSSVPQAVGTFWSALTQAQYDAAIQAAIDAAASAVAAALYDGPTVDTFADLLTLASGTIAVGEFVRIIEIDAVVKRLPDVALGNLGHTASAMRWQVFPAHGGKADIRAFGCVMDGAADDTAALQAAFDSGLPLVCGAGELRLTDTILLEDGASFEGAGGVAVFTESLTRIRFAPATKRDVFAWRTAKTAYVLAGVKLTGFCIRGFVGLVASCVNLPFLYNARLDFYAYAGVDNWITIKRWQDCRIDGGAQGFSVSGIQFSKSGIGGASDVTTTTKINAYISGGPTAYLADDSSVTDVKITGVVESVDCAIDQARGNVVWAELYTENCPRTDAGAAFKVGKTGAGAASATALRLILRPGIGFSTGATPAACVLIDADHARMVSVSGYTYLYGALLATTANTQRVILDDLDADNCPWLSLAGGIFDMSKITMTGFRPKNMQTRGDAFFSEYNLASPDLELLPADRATVTNRKLFSDAWTQKMRLRDHAGNFSLPIGALETAVDTGWTFAGARMTPGEIVGNSVRGNGRTAFWQAQSHSKDSATSLALCSTSIGSAVITRSTGVGPFSAYVVGDWVTVSAGYASATTQRRIVAVASDFSTVTLDSNATSTVVDTVTITTSAHNLVPVGQQGYRTGTATPAGSVTPVRIGEEWFDTVAKNWYKSTGLTSADWKIIT